MNGTKAGWSSPKPGTAWRGSGSPSNSRNDGEKKLMAPGNRPIDIVREGKVVKELIA